MYRIFCFVFSECYSCVDSKAVNVLYGRNNFCLIFIHLLKFTVHAKKIVVARLLTFSVHSSKKANPASISETKLRSSMKRINICVLTIRGKNFESDLSLETMKSEKHLEF